MGGRDKNFEDQMQSDQDIRKTRYGRRRFSSTHPLIWLEGVSATANLRKMYFNEQNANSTKQSEKPQNQ